MSKILVTGGAGYIGSHTIVDLINKGFDIISVDNLSRSSGNAFAGIEEIAGKPIKNYNVNLCDLASIESVFEKNKDIEGIVHFAAFKSVPESLEKPILYYANNLNSLINLLSCCKKFNVNNFVFSSSCSVYGELNSSPVSEDTPLGNMQCPYAYTKQINEQMLIDFSKAYGIKCIALRYFNPVGAHSSCKIGETPFGVPGNLFPILMEVAHGKRDAFFVHGNNYDTRDGSCIRDYVHVMDIAEAHTLALKKINDICQNKDECEIINLGTGNGISILEVIECFEKTTNIELRYSIGPRRDGDIPSIYANNNKAKKLLGWEPKRTLKEMILSAYNWTNRL